MSGILGYGEDALTLWALSDSKILSKITEDKINQIFYRPSFGRRGGVDSPQFGEFDFILTTENAVYLGESKWDGSSEKTSKGTIKLRNEQVNRHRIFRVYLEEWFKGEYKDNWSAFSDAVKQALPEDLKSKCVVTKNHKRLCGNLEWILTEIKTRVTQKPSDIKDVLIFFYEEDRDSAGIPTNTTSTNSVEFKVVPIPYPKERRYIKIKGFEI